MKIVFVGHPFHQWSKSSNFFIAELLKESEVLEFFPTIEDYPYFLKELRRINPDLVIVWQLDVVVEFIPKIFPIVFVPMLDSLIHANASYWIRLSERVKFLCFSKTVYRYLEFLGIRNSIEIQYWLPPIFNVNDKPKEKLYAYFWERDPNQVSESDARLIADKFSLDLVCRRALDLSDRNFDISDVFEKQKHIENLRNATIYIAPRNYEGIGISFLEAISFQVPVVARNLPTASEYIENGITGFLYGNGLSIKLESFGVVQDNLYRKSVIGHSAWLEKISKVIDWLPSDLQKRKRSIGRSHHSLSRFIL
jgi:hypothetical protein